MPGYYLYQSPRLETFLDRGIAGFLPSDPLAQDVLIILQNAGLSEWLKRELAWRTGVLMGLETALSEMALCLLASGYIREEASRSILFPDGLKIVSLKALEEALSSGEDAYTALSAYVGSPPREDRLVSLADAVGKLFSHYGMNCLPLVEAWEENRTYPGCRPEDRSHEVWQRLLWRRIFHSEAPYTYLSRHLTSLMASKVKYSGQYRRVILFGSVFLGEKGLEFLHYLARDIEVHHYLLTPSMAYKNVAEGGKTSQVQAEENLEILHRSGKLIRGFSAFTGEKTLKEVWYDWTFPEGQGSLLDRFRQILINDAPDGEGPPASGEANLTFHVLANRRREVEVVKEQILRSLREDPSLAPSSIGVLAPDITPYVPIIQAVFPRRDPQSGERLPGDLLYRFNDVDSGVHAPYPEGITALFDLPQGRFGCGSILDLAENPCFAAALGVDGEVVENWWKWVEELNVRWGVDADHRRQNGASDEKTGSWEFAFSRLLVAYLWEEEDLEELYPASLEGESYAEAAGLLMKLLRDLYADFGSLKNRRLSLQDWSVLGANLVNTWLCPRDGHRMDEFHHRQFQNVIRELLILSEQVAEMKDFASPEISFTAFRTLLMEKLSVKAWWQGDSRGEGVLCASLKPLRAIPFRHLHVLGMEEGAWPRREYLPSYNLRERIQGRLIDVSGENMDHYAFLETLFSAKESLTFSYVGRDPSSGEPRPPALSLQELYSALDDNIYAVAGEGRGRARKDLTIGHPLVPYDPQNLKGLGPCSSSDPEVLDLAMARRSGPPSIPHSPPPLSPWQAETEDLKISWVELLNFLKNPVKTFYLRRMGVPTFQEERNYWEGDILEPDYLLWWNWKKQVVENNPEALEEEEQLVKDFQRHLKLSGAVAEGLLGEFQEKKQEEDVKAMARQLASLRNKGLETGPTMTLRLSPSLAELLDGPSPEENIWEVPAPRFLRAGRNSVTVVGDIPGLRVLRNQKDVLYGLEFIDSVPPQARHHLQSWVTALCLGTVLPPSNLQEFRLFRLGKGNYPVRSYCYRQQVEGRGKLALPHPRRSLQALVELYLAGLTEPIPLYPEWAEKLRGLADKEDFLQIAEKSWRELMTETFFTSLPRDCPYRGHYFPAAPDFSQTWLREGLRHMYP